MNGPDHSDQRKIEERLKKACRNLHLLGPEIGKAKQIIDYDSDRRKNLLARYTVRHLKNGESAAAAEVYARADEAYQAEFKSYEEISETAHTTRAKYDAEFCSFDAARSLLAIQRETLRTLPETEQ